MVSFTLQVTIEVVLNVSGLRSEETPALGYSNHTWRGEIKTDFTGRKGSFIIPGTAWETNDK